MFSYISQTYQHGNERKEANDGQKYCPQDHEFVNHHGVHTDLMTHTDDVLCIISRFLKLKPRSSSYLQGRQLAISNLSIKF